MLLSKVKREMSRTSLFGSYRLFWAGCKWQPFLVPNLRVLGFEHATRISIKHLDLKPGVYEFAITKEPFCGQKKGIKCTSDIRGPYVRGTKNILKQVITFCNILMLRLKMVALYGAVVNT